jgi:hypothetical protein
MTKPIQHPCRRIGTGSERHFFGYYNKTNWHRSGRYLLAHEASAIEAPLTPELRATVGYFDLAGDQEFHAIGETSAWNWQMGSQLQWLDGLPGRKVIYNVRDAQSRSGFGSAIHDLETGAKRSFPTPIYVVAPNSLFALCLDYRRLYFTHETIGYSGGVTHRELTTAPGDDGISRMDLETGEASLVVSYEDLKNFHPRASMQGAIHWVSHIEINPSSDRVLFLHRWTERVEDETCFLHRLITMDVDGSNMILLECSDHPLPQLGASFDPEAVGIFDYEKSEYQISHPLWRDDGHVIVWGPHGGKIHYHLYEDADGGDVTAIGPGVLTENGHMSFSPTDKNWLLSDTYPDLVTNERVLFLYDVRNDTQHEVGRFKTDPGLGKVNRCDLHPRWSQDGMQICIDSVHEGARQIYVVDVSGLTGNR